jgi:hypothetical protein
LPSEQDQHEQMDHASESSSVAFALGGNGHAAAEGDGITPLRLGSQTLNGHSFSFSDPRGEHEVGAARRLTLHDLPCSFIAINFATTDIGPEDGPLRHIPGTQSAREPPPSLADEPVWMKRSTICPVPAGAAIIRDARCWHGGTPCVGRRARAIPNVECETPSICPPTS